MFDWQMTLCYILQFAVKQKFCSIFIYFCIFTWIFHGRAPVIPLIPYNIKFVQRGFTESAAFEKSIPHFGQRFTVLKFGDGNECCKTNGE
jgi:hypothetical protein